jgi:hypothetical protein
VWRKWYQNWRNDENEILWIPIGTLVQFLSVIEMKKINKHCSLEVVGCGILNPLKKIIINFSQKNKQK